MNEIIDIPVQDLSEIYYGIELAKKQIFEAVMHYSTALAILENERNYAGGAQEFLKVVNSSMNADLDKLSQYYEMCYMYIMNVMNVMNTFIDVEEEITRKICKEFLELE